MPGKRRTAREMALQMLYQHDLGESPLPQIFSTFDVAEYLRTATEGGENGEGPGREAAAEGDEASLDRGELRRTEERLGRRNREAFRYAKQLVSGTLDHRDEIDDLIREQADNWRLERMPAVDRNILRLAIFEMLYEEDVPKLVVVDEAIELAKRFGSDQSGRFVNGLLDGLLKQHEFPGKFK